MPYQSPIFQKTANPVAFSVGTWYNNNNKNPGKIAKTSRGEKRETQTLADWRRGLQATSGQRVLLCRQNTDDKGTSGKQRNRQSFHQTKKIRQNAQHEYAAAIL